METVTDKHVLFYQGVFSNFYPCRIQYNSLSFGSSEHFFMYEKAVQFNDSRIATAILKAPTAREAKGLGRLVKGFDEKVWQNFREQAMYKAVLAKFAQYSGLRSRLLAPEFSNKHFVEASPLDTIWGIGLSANNPDSDDESKWRGLNLLGKTLDDVREELLRFQ